MIISNFLEMAMTLCFLPQLTQIASGCTRHGDSELRRRRISIPVCLLKSRLPRSLRVRLV